MMQNKQSPIATTQRLKNAIKRLAVWGLSGLIAAIAAVVVVAPILVFFKWMFGPIPRVPSGQLPSLVDGWYMWLTVLIWLVLFFILDSRIHERLKRRFDLTQQPGGIQGQ